MDNRITIIVSSNTVMTKIKRVLKEQNLNYPIFLCPASEACVLAEREIKNGAQVIISRGWTTNVLRNQFSIPIVNMRHTYFDFVNSIKKAKLLSSKVALVGFSVAWEKILRDCYNVIDDDLTVVYIKDEMEIDGIMEDLMAKGIEVVVGGFTVTSKARKYGLHTAATEVDTVVVEDAIKEAQHLLKIYSERELRYQTISSILDCTFEGMIAIDKDGIITNINDIARKLLGGGNTGDSIRNFLSLDALLETAITGKGVFGEIICINKNTIAVNSMPIHVNNEIIGSVLTLQEITQVQMLEQQIRRKLSYKGHVAKSTFNDIIGSSKEMVMTKEKAKKFALTDCTVLIMGETGTGKELFAQSIHNYSARRKAPFVAINCGALPRGILESELFGYVSGAFTGARSEGKPGIFELAHTGTIFLDEISEMAPDVQVRLLRVIQEKEIIRVGDDRIIPVDVRIIAASNKNLYDEAQKGCFREDLYYRLNVLELKIPPLGERKSDINEIINYMFRENSKQSGQRVKKVTTGAMDILASLDWPGNIRQLGNIVERLIIMCEGDTIDEKIVKESIGIGEKAYFQRSNIVLAKNSVNNKNHKIMIRGEKIRNVLCDVGGSRKLAARKLGISTTTLWRRMKEVKEIDENFFELIYYD